ncbi:alpha/beta fold hydrolase [Oceanobacillus jeddahense]|uniref:Alpha/beta hydrolase n=1 Tax=Oceanobacillus jeddahense TaxID=1462527 RepID=A0ABY5JWM3_9BACI|nr:alpha/beta hydrolase [Oceanobacillus jeddahense]UUI04783.1 alpha/beta hydrolase [Oceanobacillus jeddahense]
MKKTKSKFRLWRILRNIFLAITAAFVSWFLFSNILTVFEQKNYPPIGEFIEVDGENMHVYIKGEGENTIVLLSGLGTAAPALDFEPLSNELAKENKVVVIEGFGYGWSDITKKERTVENIVEEIRTALKKANIRGPYILMPHSNSGIYSMYYANVYPEEVKAVIGVDATLPKALAYFDEAAPVMPEYISYLAATEMIRLAIYISPEDFLPITAEGTYSEENLKMTKAISAWKVYNKNVVAEANEIENNIEKTIDMTFPTNIPVLLFTREDDKEAEGGKNMVAFYKTQIANSSVSKIVTLEGHHYLHWTRFEEISDEVREFIKSFAE